MIHIKNIFILSCEIKGPNYVPVTKIQVSRNRGIFGEVIARELVEAEESLKDFLVSIIHKLNNVVARGLFYT